MLSKRRLPLAVLLLLVCLVYANSFGNSFHFDDFHTITDNPAVRSLGNLPRIFTDTSAFSVLPANQTYRPLVTASLALDYALAHGYDPFWFHVSTLLWFLLLIALIARWAEQIFEAAAPGRRWDWPALGVAAWFGLHPAMAETVNYVIQRGDLYCTLGCVAGLVLYAEFPAQRRLGLYLLPFVLGMLSKPPAAVFPLLLLLYVQLFEATGRTAWARWRQSLRAAVPALGGAALLLWFEATMTPRSYTPSIVPAAAYRMTQPYVWLRYAAALWAPLHLNVDTDLQPITRWNAQAAAGLSFVVVLLLASAYAARRRRLAPVAYGLLWFAVTQLPTSLYTLSEVENDHRMFFSFPGLMLAAVWAVQLGMEWLAGRFPVSARWQRRVAAGTCLLALAGYAYGAHRRNQVWRDEASLWADDVAKSPHNGRGLMNYGLIKLSAGDAVGALALFDQALRYTPNYATLEINLGVGNGLLAERGQPALRAVAESHFQRAIALAPADDLPRAYFGRWLLEQGRLPEATTQLETAVALNGQRALQRDLLLKAYTAAGNTGAAQALAKATLAVIPEDAAAVGVLHGTAAHATTAETARWINASLAAYRAGRFPESIVEAQKALELDPDSAEAWNNVGAGYGALQQWEQGLAAEQHALRLNPGLGIAANNLRWFTAEIEGRVQGGERPEGQEPHSAAAWVERSLRLNQAGNYPGSLAAAQRALALDPGSAEAWNNIAAGNEAMGRWDAAIAAARQALALRPDFALAKNNLQWSLQQKAVGGRQ